MENFDSVSFPSPERREQIGDETAMAFFRARFGAKKRDFGRP
jgi:hypothetical protein